MINQFHDRIELRAFLDGHSVSGVSTNSVMSTSLVKGDGQRRPLLVGVLVLDGDPHQEEAVALTRGFDALLRLHPGDHVVIPRHLLVEASHHRVLKSCPLRSKVLQKRRPRQIQSRRLPRHSFLQVFNSKSLKDKWRLRNRSFTGGCESAEKAILMLLMMLDQLNRSWKGLAPGHLHHPIRASLDDVVVDLLQVHD